MESPVQEILCVTQLWLRSVHHMGGWRLVHACTSTITATAIVLYDVNVDEASLYTRPALVRLQLFYKLDSLRCSCNELIHTVATYEALRGVIVALQVLFV